MGDYQLEDSVAIQIRNRSTRAETGGLFGWSHIHRAVGAHARVKFDELVARPDVIEEVLIVAVIVEIRCNHCADGCRSGHLAAGNGLSKPKRQADIRESVMEALSRTWPFSVKVPSAF